MTWTPDEVLTLAKAAMLRPGGYDYTNHFLQRMEDRDARVGDVKRAFRTATGASPRDNESWRITGGKDADDVPLEPIIAILSGDKGSERIRLITILG